MDVQGVECDVRLDVCDEEGGGYNIVGAAYCCDYCGLVTGSRAELVLHMRLEHAADFGGTPTAEEAEGGDAKECVEGMPVGGEEVGDLVGQLVGCLSETSGKRRGRGRPRKDSAPMFKCHLCHFETSHKRPLLRHVADHLKSFSCGTCGHSAQTFDELEQHTCSPGAYPRSVYDMRVANLRRLKKYMNEIEKPYACETCSYRSCRLGDLVVHRRCHTGEKPYPCGLCDYRGATSSHLAKHVRVHHTGAGLECDLCGFRGLDRRHMLAHRKARHAPRPLHPCPTCSFQASTKGQLTNHMKVHVKVEHTQHDIQDDGVVSDPTKNDPDAFESPPTDENDKIDAGRPRIGTEFVSVKEETEVGEPARDPQEAVEKHDVPLIRPEHIKVEPSLEEYEGQNEETDPVECENIAVETKAKGSKNKSKARFICQHCGGATATRRSLVNHIRTYHGDSASVKFGCPTEEQVVSRLVARAATLLTSLACDQCQFVGANRSKLEAHKRKHTGERPYPCDKCEYRAATRGSLNVHAKIHMAKKPFVCEVCGYSTVNRTRLRRHMWVHNGEEKPFACDQCSYRCDRMSYLEIHQRVHSGARPFVCDLCDYRAISKAQLGAHRKLHDTAAIVSCELCGYRVAGERLLAMHRKTHDRIDPARPSLLACGMCEFTTGTAQNLRRHRANHTGARPYACALCDYRTSERNYLAAHQAVHTGRRPYACEQCHYTTAYKSCLAEHALRHTNHAPFLCDSCDYRTSHRSALRRHKDKQHPQTQ